MQMKWMVTAALAGCALAACAQADESKFPVQCSFDDAAPTACHMTDQVGADGTHTMEFTAGSRRLKFVGKSQTGWWSGQLDGQAAMGFERNRGYVVFSTTDLKTSFAWWSQGSEHGSY